MELTLEQAALRQGRYACYEKDGVTYTEECCQCGRFDVQICCCDGPYDDGSCEDPVCIYCHKYAH